MMAHMYTYNKREEIPLHQLGHWNTGTQGLHKTERNERERVSGIVLTRPGTAHQWPLY